MIVDLPTDAPGSISVAAVLTSSPDLESRVILAKHLVGACLATRFPETTIDHVTLVDRAEPLKHVDGFHIGDTLILLLDDFLRMRLAGIAEQLGSEKSAYILVPAEHVESANRLVSADPVGGKVAVSTVEDFVGQMLDGLGGYSSDSQFAYLAEVVKESNRRAAAAGDIHCLIDLLVDSKMAPPSAN